jgi:hypothetical protein
MRARCLEQSLDVVIALPSVRSSPSMRRVSWVLFGWYGCVGCRGWLHAFGAKQGAEKLLHAARTKRR